MRNLFFWSDYSLSWGLEHNLSNFYAVPLFPTEQEKFFSCWCWAKSTNSFHFSTFPAALIQFRAYDSNTKTERVVRPETAMMNAPLLCVLVCFGVACSGGRTEFYASLFRCIFLTAAALLCSSRQRWLNGNSSVIWIKTGETRGR